MKIGFVVNDIATEKAIYTTTRLGMTAVNRAHEVWFLSASDFALDADDRVHAWARSAPGKKYSSPATFLKAIHSDKAHVERIVVDDLDVLMLRNNPASESERRAWARTAGINFGRVALLGGVIVLNDPNALALAMDKMYLQLLPEAVRPRSVISLDADELKAFVKEVGGNAVLKPLQGSGDRSIFRATPSNKSNVNQMIEAVSRDGYVIAQEYLDAADHSLTRMFLVNGEPLRFKGKYAAFQWDRTEDSLRQDIHVAGSTKQVKLTDTHMRIAEAVRPRLVQDGMFFVGLQIAGDKLLDIDVFSPGGLGNAQAFEKVNFSQRVIEEIEHKVDYVSFYKRRFDNVDMATL
ncbi:MAG: glutathione synthase [Proteobacteria bacterium]|nr:glutathione synthase [Pseudomonadota bacterium]